MWSRSRLILMITAVWYIQILYTGQNIRIPSDRKLPLHISSTQTPDDSNALSWSLKIKLKTELVCRQNPLNITPWEVTNLKEGHIWRQNLKVTSELGLQIWGCFFKRPQKCRGFSWNSSTSVDFLAFILFESGLVLIDGLSTISLQNILKLGRPATLMFFTKLSTFT